MADMDSALSLDKVRPALREPPPLLMTPACIDRSRDVFGIEFLDFQLRHETIVGEDGSAPGGFLGAAGPRAGSTTRPIGSGLRACSHTLAVILKEVCRESSHTGAREALCKPS